MTSLLTPAKLRHLQDLTREVLKTTHSPLAEVGVYRGGSARAILQALDGSWRLLHLFDTFTGLPAPGPNDGVLREGQFACSLGEVMKALRGWEHMLKYHVGQFPDSASGIETTFALAHIDVDLESSVTACCEWFSTHMSRGGVLIFDDYSSPTTPGCRRAVDAFFSKDRIKVAACGPAVVRF